MRDNKGRFEKGKKNEHEEWCRCAKCDPKLGKRHPGWKGGVDRFPKCWCGKRLSRMDAKVCRKHPSKEAREKMSLAREGKYKDENHPGWKGNEVGYRGVHMWLQRKLGKPRRCDICGNKKLKHRQYHWANISRKYKREKSDWLRLCVKCHKAFDKKPKPNHH